MTDDEMDDGMLVRMVVLVFVLSFTHCPRSIPPTHHH